MLDAQFAQLFRSCDLRGMRVTESWAVFREQFDYRTDAVLLRRAQIVPPRHEPRRDNHLVGGHQRDAPFDRVLIGASDQNGATERRPGGPS